MLAVVAILFYVFVYSMWLKRRTSQNIVWGGLAGCMPVIIGWSAVTGDIGWPAWVFFGVIFFWTPPHTWALAMRYREDYAAAGVPMLPVVATEREVVRQIVLYSWAMVACSLLLVPASSWIYAAVAVPLGLWFLAMAHLLHTRVLRGAAAKPMTLFHLSNLYLTGDLGGLGRRLGGRPAGARAGRGDAQRTRPVGMAPVADRDRRGAGRSGCGSSSPGTPARASR